MATEYDIVILGGGPAGMTAALYAGRSRLRVAVIEKMATGGQMAIASFIENFPGFIPGVTGFELTQKMEEHAKEFGAEIEYAEIHKIRPEAGHQVVETSEGKFVGKSVIIATGAAPRRLGVPGEDEFVGRGVSFCAVCDGALYKEKKVVVVGGGDSAVDEAMYLTRFATQVTLIHRRNELRAIRVLQERAFVNPKLNLVLDSVVERVLGQDKVAGVVVRNVKTGVLSEIASDGVFVYIGLVPNSEFVPDLLERDNGYIVTDEDMATNIPGIFAAGDVRRKSLRQVITAAADGAIAAYSAEKYIESLPVGRGR